MAFREYKRRDLAKRTGRPEDSFTDYATVAIDDAILLFKMATCLTGPPEGHPYAEQAIDNAILSLADRLYLEQPYARELATPFTSENLGSYSYSKSALTMAVRTKKSTGVMWFDEAVAEFGVCEDLDNVPTGGGVEVFEHGDYYVPGHGGDHNTRFLGPDERDLWPDPPVSRG